MPKITLSQLNKKLDMILEMLEGKSEQTDGFIIITDDGKKKTSELFDECRKLFPVYSCYSDDQLNKYFPSVKTKFRYRLTQESDEELKNLSADDLEKKGIKGITLRERIIYELRYFKKTGQHLDIYNITLCSGSRYDGGSVPRARWLDDKFRVDWDHPGLAHDGLRSRQRFPL